MSIVMSLLQIKKPISPHSSFSRMRTTVRKVLLPSASAGFRWDDAGSRAFLAFARMTMVVVLSFIVGFVAQAKPRSLMVETSASYPPFTFVERGQVVGFDIDLINMMANNMGYDLEIKDVAFKDLFVDLKNKKADLAIAAITATPERMKELHFSGRYYFPEFALLHKRDDNIKSVEDLNNKTVAVLSGSTMEEFLTKELSPGKKMTIRAFHNTHFMLGALNTKEIDAALVEDVTAQQEGKSFSYFLIKTSRPDGYAIMFQKDSDLADEFNDELVKLKASKQFEDLKKKWGV